MKQITFIVITIIAIACNQKPAEEPKAEFPVTIDLIQATKAQKKIMLSDIADSIVYVKPEVVKDRPVSQVLYFAWSDNSIFINGGQSSGFLRFDMQGKFLNAVGRRGRGLKEYPPGSEFSVTDKPPKVFISTKFYPCKILEYDYSGYLIEERFISNIYNGGFEAISYERFLFLASTLLITDEEDKDYMACLKDNENNVVAAVKHPLLPGAKNEEAGKYIYGGVASGRYFDDAPLFFDEFSMDTVYSVKKDTIYPRYILDKGFEGMPFGINYSEARYSERYKYLYVVSSSFVETPANVHFIFIYRNNSYLATFNKAEKTITSMISPFCSAEVRNSAPPSFENDIDGGISVIPGKPNRRGDVWAYVFPSSSLKRKLTKEHFSHNSALYPGKKEALQKFVNSLDYSDETVVMVIYLKK